MLIKWVVAVSMVLLSCIATPLLAGEVPASARLSLWTPDDTMLVLGGLAGIGLLSLYDEDLGTTARENRFTVVDDLAEGFGLLGEPLVSLGLGGALWGYGSWRQDPPLAREGREAFEAVLLANVATAAVKYAVGRERPNVSGQSDAFSPLSFDPDHDSLPSGHASGAFALASVLSHHSTHSLAPWGYYGLAALVGLSRIYQDEHWASDVALGALIGEVSSRLVIRFHERNGTGFFALRPWGGDGVGLQWVAIY